MAVVTSFFAALLELAGVVLSLYVWILIVGAVLSWLTAFDVVNTRNRFVSLVGEFCYRVTEPALRPIRRFMPVVGGLDLSPMVLIFAIWFLQSFLRNLMASLFA